jgi:hypothetical protein
LFYLAAVALLSVTFLAVNGHVASPASLSVSNGQLDTIFTGLNRPAASVYPPDAFPKPVNYYQPYVGVITPLWGATREFDLSTAAGKGAISVGIVNGSAAVQVSFGSQLLLSATVEGDFFNYIVISEPKGYCSANFTSTGQTLNLTVTALSEQPLVSYVMYNNFINDQTAALVVYPKQFAINIGPQQTPVNSGVSFLVVAPTYDHPQPLSIWVAEAHNYPPNPSDSPYWWAQVGLIDYTNSGVSYPFFEVFSNIIGNSPTYVDTAHPLTPGETYNFTMSQIPGNQNWQFTVNNTLIAVSNQTTGILNLTTNTANSGGDLGLETWKWMTGSVAITTPITIPLTMNFRVNGVWTQPSNLVFYQLGESWQTQSTLASGLDLWGIAGNLQDPSIPNGALLFNDSLPMPLFIPGIGYQPIWGNFTFPKVPYGGGIVDISRVDSTTLKVTPVGGEAYVAVVTYSVSSNYITSEFGRKISSPTTFAVPNGTVTTAVYAANRLFDQTSAFIAPMSGPFPTPTLPQPTPSAAPTPIPTVSTSLPPTSQPVPSPTQTSAPTPQATTPTFTSTPSTSIPTSSPKITPFETSTSMPSVNPAVSESPQVPEFSEYSVFLAFAVFSAIATVAVILRKRN